jgi:hypothetical protein
MLCVGCVAHILGPLSTGFLDEDEDTTLFRTDGMATKTVRNYFSMIAGHYVGECLQESVSVGVELV